MNHDSPWNPMYWVLRAVWTDCTYCLATRLFLMGFALGAGFGILLLQGVW